MNKKVLSPKSFRLSVVVPVFNEQDVLAEFHRRLQIVLDGVCTQNEASADIVYVNDGSSDASLSILAGMKKADPRIAILDLSRNFGKEIALTAGLDHARGDAVVVIDADLQDPPELIPEMLARWHEGFDMVYAQRVSRAGESAIKKTTAHLFYRTMKRLSRIRIPEDVGDYRLLSRRAVNALTTLREQHRFMKGLFAWIGYRQIAISYARDPRYSGETKWHYFGLWNLALEGFTSFSTIPLKIATYLGLVAALGALLYGMFIFLQTVLYGNPVPGYPSLLVVILFLGGIQLIALGVIGEYLGRMFDETKGRPLYFVNCYDPARPDGGDSVATDEGNNEAC